MSARYELVDLMGDIGFGANQPATAVVHIVSTPRGFRVVQAGRLADGMGFDEMLGQIVALLHPKLGAPHYEMLTREGHAERAARHEARMAKINKDGSK